MRAVPKIILTSKFTFSEVQSKTSKSDYGSYATNYMGRKVALESKSYLSPEEETKLLQRELAMRGDEVVKISEFAPQTAAENSLAKANLQELNHQDIVSLGNEDYGKYIGYMMRREALASKKQNQGLSEKEEAELKRVSSKTDVYELPSIKKDKILPGYFSATQKTIQLKDLDDIRKRMREAQANQSILWQDVISFDNNFLREMGVFDPTTGYLDETSMREASLKMMAVLEKDENLNNIFWTASIHRNTDNIHIHFGIVEQANSRPLKKVVDQKGNVHFEPKGWRKLSTIEDMKHTFARSMFDNTELLKDMNLQRNAITKSIAETYDDNLKNDTFQKKLNAFVLTLPDDKNKWRWADLNKTQRNKLTNLVDLAMKDDSAYKKWNAQFKKYKNYYEALYGHSKVANKNDTVKKWEDMKKRAGNALLKQIRATALSTDQVHSNYTKGQKDKVFDNAAKFYHNKASDYEFLYRKKANFKSKFPRGSQLQGMYHEKTKLGKQLEKSLKKNVRPTFSKRSSNKAVNIIRLEMEKNLATFEKSKALAEYAQMQKNIEIEQERR
ncbi:MobP2 family relaxase [Lactobacillus apis]|uniref:MobP2 family relaxase n=1 Tax=Lactobacillus apis TaxID=303541 RepID=UPI0024328F7E|nr:MobP2 family relaxase [Lactobacillus apis]